MSMRRDYLLFASRVLSWFFFLGSTVVPTLGPSAPFNREFSSISLLFSLIITNLPFTVERYGYLCVACFKADDEKQSDSATSCVLAVVYPHCERMLEGSKSMNRIVHVDGLLYTVDLRFRSIRSCLYEVFVDGFSFLAFL